MGAIDGLASVVAHIEDDDANERYRRWLRSMTTAEKAAMAGHPDVESLLVEMGSVYGWGSRARQVQGMLRKASKAARAPDREWIDQLGPAVSDLDADRNGVPKRHILNATILLRGTDAGRDLAWNEFAGRAYIDGEPMQDWHVSAIQRELIEFAKVDFAVDTLTRAIELLAREERSYHPVRDYLDGLSWDGVERVPMALQDFFGAAPDAVTTAYSRAWFVGAVRRIYEPGCKFDEMLILYGAEGLGKSTGLRALVGADWFRDDLIDPKDKDLYQSLPGTWLYEVGEVERWTRYDLAPTLKAILSKQHDNYRPSYGRNFVRVPRQTLFVGTTNQAEHVSDPTSQRRYWSVHCVDRISVASIEAIRDQLWAEAVHRYRAGEPSHLTGSEMDLHRESIAMYEEERPEEERIARYLSGQPGEVAIGDVLSTALEVPPERQTPGQARRAADVMRRLGWSKTRSSQLRDGRRPMVWVRR